MRDYHLRRNARPGALGLSAAWSWSAFSRSCCVGALVLDLVWARAGLSAETPPANPAVPAEAPKNVTPAPDGASAGEKAARIYCVSCHIFPEPDLLDKKTWKDQTLRRMKMRVGLSPGDIERHPEAKLLKATGVFPEKPMLTEQEWNSIIDYYVKAAPEQPPPQAARPPIPPNLTLFTAERPKFRLAPPSTTMVHISQPSGKIFVGDAETKSLGLLSLGGDLLGSIKMDNVPVSLSETARGLYVTMIGHFMPSEDPQGALVFLERTETGFKPPQTILKDLPRVTYTEFGDLNGDGKTDFVTCLYGNNAGRFVWYENLGNEKYEEHLLLAKSGAIRAAIHDFDGDGFPDIGVLVAQELETFFILRNDGKGHFTIHPVFQKPPIYGHTYFELDDFNGDGRKDLLVTNGDNGEYPSPAKRYHGLRIYLNQGDLNFEERFFFPLNGAFKAVARDFDGDGDLDIAAISFFPDYSKSPEESFVYLENQGNLQFKASTFPQFFMGRWLTMDVGDLDGDGDLDIVLGSYIRGPSDVPEGLAQTWEKAGPSALILRNRSH